MQATHHNQHSKGVMDGQAGGQAAARPAAFPEERSVFDALVDGPNVRARAQSCRERALITALNRALRGLERLQAYHARDVLPLAAPPGWVSRCHRVCGHRSTEGTRRPYIWMHDKRYSSPELKQRFDLIGQPLIVHTCRLDGTMRAYFSDGRRVHGFGLADDCDLKPLSRANPRTLTSASASPTEFRPMPLALSIAASMRRARRGTSVRQQRELQELLQMSIDPLKPCENARRTRHQRRQAAASAVCGLRGQ